MIALENQLDYDFSDHILVVDPARGTRRILAALLERKLSPVRVTSAESASEALQLMAREHFTLITTAFELPDMDGVSLAEQVHAHAGHVDTPVIVVSGDSGRSSGARFYGKGITGFFDRSQGYQRLIDYIRWLSPSAALRNGRVLCTSRLSSSRFNEAWKQLTRCDYNVLQANGYRDILSTLRSALEQPGKQLDLLVVETSRDQYASDLELVFQIRHDLHVTPLVLPILVASSEPLDSTVMLEFCRAGANDAVRLPVPDELLACKVNLLMTLGQQYRQISNT